jgi:hypothetical protein
MYTLFSWRSSRSFALNSDDLWSAAEWQDRYDNGDKEREIDRDGVTPPPYRLLINAGVNIVLLRECMRTLWSMFGEMSVSWMK